jgi:hypothetical protein
MKISLKATALCTAMVLALMGAATAENSHHRQDATPKDYSAIAPNFESARQIVPGQPASAFFNETDESGYRPGHENPNFN